MSKAATPIRLIVDLGDLHCGSTVGLCPPGFVRQDETGVVLNPVQEWLWACWLDAMAWLGGVLDGDPFALVVKGDVREGNHHGTTEIISPENGDHDEAAFQVLEPLAKKAARTYVLLGTECHVKNGEHTLASRLGARRPPGAKGTRAAWDKLFLSVNGVRSTYQHHISTSSRMYLRASRLSIHLGNEQLEAVNNREAMPQILSAAHCHIYDYYERPGSCCYTTPPWQLLTRHGNKVVTSSRTTPGLVVQDYRGKEPGELPEIHARTYRPPGVPDEVL